MIELVSRGCCSIAWTLRMSKAVYDPTQCNNSEFMVVSKYQYFDKQNCRSFGDVMPCWLVFTSQCRVTSLETLLWKPQILCCGLYWLYHCLCHAIIKVMQDITILSPEKNCVCVCQYEKCCSLNGWMYACTHRLYCEDFFSVVGLH
jgi:hypothetical protein